jgi:hypothetical protein
MMATGYGTGGSLNNCVLYLDASNPKSYPGAGTTWYDLSGNNLNATLTNGPIWGANNQGVINYDGTNDYVATGTSANLNFSSSNFSVELWVYMNSTMGSDGVYHGVLSIGTTTGGETFLLGIWRSGLYPGCFYSTYGTATNYMFGTNGNDPNYTGNYYNGLSKWTHVVFTKNGGTSYFYLNGQLWASKATPSLPSTSSNFVSIGLASGVYLIGQAPLLRIYNRALTATEAFNNFAATRNRFVGSLPFSPTDISGLKLWLDADDSRTLFSDTSGTTKATTDGTAVALWVDKSGNGNNVSQSTASARPAVKSTFINGRNVLNFDGSNDTLTAPSSTATFKFLHSTTSTVFIVVQYKSPASTYTSYFTTASSTNHVGYLILRYTNDKTGMPYIAGGVGGSWVAVNESDVGYIDNAQFYLVCCACDPTNATAANRATGYKNGRSPFKNNTQTLTPSNANSTYDLAIGSEGGVYYANVYIAEILAYNSILTASQRIQVETYLNNKWGLWASFNPSSISGLQLWLDSSDPATLYQDTGGVIPAFNDGDPVALWKDKSGNARDASQTTSTQRPLLKKAIQNSKNILRFDGSNDYFGLPAGNYGDSLTCFIVYKWTAASTPGNAGYLYAFAGSVSPKQKLNVMYMNSSQPTYYFGERTNTAYLGNTSKDVYFVNTTTFASPYAAANLATYDNGISLSISSFGSIGSGGATNDNVIGADKITSGIQTFTGDMAEIIVYNSVLTTAQRQQVEQYLNQKWGVF